MSVNRRHEQGVGGFCVCPKCNERVPHQRGIPCQDERCPACGAKLLREGSYHHRLLEKKQAKRQEGPTLTHPARP
jgi:hypothetical protein